MPTGRAVVPCKKEVLITKSTNTVQKHIRGTGANSRFQGAGSPILDVHHAEKIIVEKGKFRMSGQLGTGVARVVQLDSCLHHELHSSNCGTIQRVLFQTAPPPLPFSHYRCNPMSPASPNHNSYCQLSLAPKTLRCGRRLACRTYAG